MKVKNIKYEPLKVQGVGGKPFVNMDRYLDLSQLTALEAEANVGLAKSKNLTHGFILGEACPWEKEHFPQPFEAEILSDIEKFDPAGIHRQAMATMSAQERRRYLYFALGAQSPWYATLYLRFEHFRDKTTSDLKNDWEPDAEHFPLLKQYIESLKGTIFKSIGRVLFFISYPGVATICHRDFAPETHRDHCINIYLKGWRPAYIWDPIESKKVYLEKGCRSYFFNNRDYHGVDADPYFNYTLRIDGQFKQHLLDELNIPSGEL